MTSVIENTAKALTVKDKGILAAMIRLHLMTYINLAAFLKSPEKALLNKVSANLKTNYQQLLFIT